MADSKSTDKSNWTYDTKAIHAGQEYDQWSNLETVPPIVTSMTFYQNDPAKMTGYYYSRVGNPTRDAFQRAIATLDNGKYGLVYPSGCAAVTAMLHLLKSGDHIISCSEQYGGTRLLFLDYVKIQGIEIDFVDASDINDVKNAIKPNTKLIWTESPSNPCLTISDIAAIAELAHSRKEKIIFAIDNTLLTSFYQRPLELGADIVMYSLTKYMNGHNDVLGGALVVNDPDIHEILLRVQTKYGSVLSPFDCFLVHRGLKTLPLRMQKHSESSIAIAQFLEAHAKVVKVHHLAMPSHPQYELAKKQSSGHSGIVTFQIDGTVENAKKFVQSLRVFASSGSLGSFESFAMIPVFVSHFSVPNEEREKAGIFDSTVRLSLGLENANDLIADINQALRKAFEEI